MSHLVDPTVIEGIVGAERQQSVHMGRAVSAEQNVYVLHSADCLATGADMRACEFSVALDLGIDRRAWAGSEDKPVQLAIHHDRLVPHAPAGGAQ